MVFMEFCSTGQAAIHKAKYSKTVQSKETLIEYLHAEEWWLETIKSLQGSFVIKPLFV